MNKIILITLFAFLSFFSHAQIVETYWGRTLLNTELLLSSQTDSKLLPSHKNAGLTRLIVNHQLSYQYHFLFRNRVELNIGLGLNIQYYSVRVDEDIYKVKNFLNIEQELVGDERYYDVIKIRFNNKNLTTPIGIKFFFKKAPLARKQVALSFQFSTEYNIHNYTNARYIASSSSNSYVLNFLPEPRVNYSSIDSDIEHFYNGKMKNITHTFRFGFSFQKGNDIVKRSSLDLYYVHYFNSFDSGITTPARGLSFSLKKQF